MRDEPLIPLDGSRLPVSSRRARSFAVHFLEPISRLVRFLSEPEAELGQPGILGHLGRAMTSLFNDFCFVLAAGFKASGVPHMLSSWLPPILQLESKNESGQCQRNCVGDS